MPTRAQTAKENFTEKEIRCSNEDCPVITKVCVPSTYDCSRPFFCGFCAAMKENHPKSYANVLVDNLTKENKARSCIAREIRQEQIEQDNKKLNLIIKGSVPSNSPNDSVLVQNLAQEIGVELNSDDFDSLRIGKKNAENSRQLLLLKFKSVLKRKQFLGNAKKLKDSKSYSNLFVDPDLTKSEREAQYQLRVEKRSLQQKYTNKSFVIRNGRVTERK